MGIKRCKAAFVTMKDGRPRMLNPGALVDESDPIVAEHPTQFEDVETYVSDRLKEAVEQVATVEQATAAPGEKRTRSKAAAKRNEPRPSAGTPKMGQGEGA